MPSWEGVEAEIAKGRPLLIFLFSDNCGACLATRPIVDGIERDLVTRLAVLRVIIASKKEIAFTPYADESTLATAALPARAKPSATTATATK